MPINKKILAALAVPAGLLGLIAGIVHAQAPRTPTVVTSTTVKQLAESDVTTPAETTALQAQATISADQATTAAKAKVSGIVTATTLEDENGSAVYQVTIGTTDVKVDAKTGTIIKVETLDQQEIDANNQVGDQPAADTTPDSAVEASDSTEVAK